MNSTPPISTPDEGATIRLATAPTPEDRARSRFITAAAGQPPTDEQKAAVRRINGLVVDLAIAIEETVPGARNRALALTALEDVNMRANRGIFATGPSA